MESGRGTDHFEVLLTITMDTASPFASLTKAEIVAAVPEHTFCWEDLRSRANLMVAIGRQQMEVQEQIMAAASSKASSFLCGSRLSVKRNHPGSGDSRKVRRRREGYQLKLCKGLQ
jgi:hypothetical protein